MPTQKHEFHMHAKWDMKPVPKVIFHLSKSILDDPKATTESRTLAALMIELATTMDNFVTAMENGTWVVQLPEDDMRRIAAMRASGQLNNDEL